MKFRHLCYFIAVAEELHFARAAARLHIEQSPLSRAIRELEVDLEVQLFERDPRGTRLTWAGQILLEDAKRIVTAIGHARTNVKSAASGYRGLLRVAVSEGLVPQRLARLLDLCRQQDPDVDIRLYEIPLAQHLSGLRGDLYDAGFCRSDEVAPRILATPVWNDPLVVAVPVHHPLLIHPCIPLAEVLKYPLVLCQPEACSGAYAQIMRLLHTADGEPMVAQQVTSLELMLALVSVGCGLGFVCEAQVTARPYAGVVPRALAGTPAQLTTFLLRPDKEPSAQLARFIGRIT